MISPPHWISAGIGLMTVAKPLFFIVSRTKKDAHRDVVTPEIFVPNSGTTRVPSLPPPKEGDVGW